MCLLTLSAGASIFTLQHAPTPLSFAARTPGHDEGPLTLHADGNGSENKRAGVEYGSVIAAVKFLSSPVGHVTVLIHISANWEGKHEF